MSEIYSVQLTAVATLALAILAFATAVLALLAWRKQSKEVRDQAEMLELQRQQLKDQQDASARQAAMLELQGTQLADQQTTNAEQVKVLKLQAQELQESLEERRREAGDRLRSQAAAVTTWLAQDESPFGDEPLLAAVISNQSGQPI